MAIFSVLVAILYVVAFAAVYAYGINYVHLAYLAWRRRDERPRAPTPSSWPAVTVQIPLYNELHVAERAIDAAARLDYPAELLEIQVLDDSTDATTEIARAAVERLRRQGVKITCLHRSHRTGFKAGALADGLSTATGEFIAIFDADATPPPDFLRRTVPHFHNPRVAFVQARWGHLNRDYSLLTLLNSLMLDAEFMVTQFARAHGGYWFSFNGSGGVWRRSAIADAGGWSGDTLTEDMDLAYRAFLRGWTAVYLRDVEVPTELPITFSAFRRQQHRWARGNLECAIKLLRRTWQARTPLRVKAQATFHLTGFCAHILLCLLALLSPLALLLPEANSVFWSVFSVGFVLNVPMLAPVLFLILSQHQLGRRWWRLLPLLPLIVLLGTSMMLNTLRAGLQAVRRTPRVFERTPKFGVVRRGERRTTRYPVDFDPIVIFEFALALINVWVVFAAFQAGNRAVGMLSAFLCQVLLSAALWTLAHAFGPGWWRWRAEYE